jgi:hypothetical protein
MVVTGFRMGGGGGGGGELEDELDDEPEDEVVVGVVLAAAMVVENADTVSSPRLTTKILEVAPKSAYAGMIPTFDCEIAVSPETSMVVLAPA